MPDIFPAFMLAVLKVGGFAFGFIRLPCLLLVSDTGKGFLKAAVRDFFVCLLVVLLAFGLRLLLRGADGF